MGASYAELEKRFGSVGRLQAVEGLLCWDTEVMMPAAGTADRAEQLAALRESIHQLEVDPVLADLLPQAEEETLDAWQHANLREMRRRYDSQRAIPSELVADLARAGTECSVAWRKAREQDDFARLQPYLARVVALVRRIAAIKGEALGLSPYDALMEGYEPGTRAERVSAIFDQLSAFLPGLIATVLDKQSRTNAPLQLPGPFPPDKQRALGRRMMAALGFNFDEGRLDVSTHPFCSGIGGDVRITARYDPRDFSKALMAVVHETGHALYEQGLPAAWRYQPVGLARGMAVHESQSLLVEMQACRSADFWQWAAPIICDVFEVAGPAWRAENLFEHHRRVSRSTIRVDADELTYPMHVILRYRLERALIADDLRVDELPAAWNEAMRELVGISPPNDREGCLQDIHWMDGTFGYFPTYTLGAMMAAQLYEAAIAAAPGIPDAISQGNFAPLLNWLRTNVHAKASSVTSDELLRAATGRPLDVAIYQQNLHRRYLGC